MDGLLVTAKETIPNENDASPSGVVRVTRKEALVGQLVVGEKLSGGGGVSVSFLERDDVGVDNDFFELAFSGYRERGVHGQQRAGVPRRGRK